MRQLSSLFGKTDTFDVVNFTPIPKIESPVPTPSAPAKEVYTVPIGTTSLIFDKWSYKFTKYTIITIAIGIILMITAIIVYLLATNLGHENIAAPADETTASQIQNFMNATLQGINNSTGAEGFKLPSDCDNQYNNCIYTLSNNTFSCVKSTVNPDIPIWIGPRCQDPIVTPYYATLVDPDDPGLDLWGSKFGSVETGDPSQLLEAMLAQDNVIGATYDLTFSSTRFQYQLYTKRTDPPDDYTNSYNVLQTNLLQGGAYPVVNFNEFSNGKIVLFKSLQNIGTGGGSIRIAYSNSPLVGDLINGNGTVDRLDTGQSITVTGPYSIYNGDQTQIQLNINGVISTTQSNFIPLTNFNNQKVVITLLGG